MMRGSAVLILSMVVGAMAMPAAAQEVHAGALGGFGWTSFAFSPAPPVDFTKPARPSAGGLVSVDLTGAVGLETRVVWQRKAVRWQESEGGLTATATAEADYVSVPVLVRLVAPAGRTRPYALAGAEVSFKTRAALTGSVESPSGDPTVVLDEEFSGQVRGTDVALAVGGGVEFPAGRVSIFFDGLYTHGLRNVPGDAADSEFVNTKARTFRVSAGIRF